MKKVALALVTLSLCSLSFGQILSKVPVRRSSKPTPELVQQKIDAAKSEPRSILATSDCSFTFNEGVTDNSVEYCVTVNGNIPEFTRNGTLLISSDRREGYGICDINSGLSYFDYASFGDSGNWNPATVLSHNGTTVKIARSTNDGIWTLTQTITKAAASLSAKVVMSLKNNTAVDRGALVLRYTDVDVDNNISNNFDATDDDAFGWNSITGTNPGAPRGIALQDVGNLNLIKLGFAQNTPSGPDPCNPTTNFVSAPLINVDGSIVQAYEFGVAKGKSKSVTVAYKPL